MKLIAFVAALLLASGAWGQSLSQQRHDDDFARLDQ